MVVTVDTTNRKVALLNPDVKIITEVLEFLKKIDPENYLEYELKTSEAYLNSNILGSNLWAQPTTATLSNGK